MSDTAEATRRAADAGRGGAAGGPALFLRWAFAIIIGLGVALCVAIAMFADASPDGWDRLRVVAPSYIFLAVCAVCVIIAHALLVAAPWFAAVSGFRMLSDLSHGARGQGILARQRAARGADADADAAAAQGQAQRAETAAPALIDGPPPAPGPETTGALEDAVEIERILRLGERATLRLCLLGGLAVSALLLPTAVSALGLGLFQMVSGLFTLAPARVSSLVQGGIQCVEGVVSQAGAAPGSAAASYLMQQCVPQMLSSTRTGVSEAFTEVARQANSTGVAGVDMLLVFVVFAMATLAFSRYATWMNPATRLWTSFAAVAFFAVYLALSATLAVALLRETSPAVEELTEARLQQTMLQMLRQILPQGLFKSIDSGAEFDAIARGGEAGGEGRGTQAEAAAQAGASTGPAGTRAADPAARPSEAEAGLKKGVAALNAAHGPTNSSDAPLPSQSPSPSPAPPAQPAADAPPPPASASAPDASGRGGAGWSRTPTSKEDLAAAGFSAGNSREQIRQAELRGSLSLLRLQLEAESLRREGDYRLAVIRGGVRDEAAAALVAIAAAQFAADRLEAGRELTGYYHETLSWFRGEAHAARRAAMACRALKEGAASIAAQVAAERASMGASGEDLRPVFAVALQGMDATRRDCIDYAGFEDPPLRPDFGKHLGGAGRMASWLLSAHSEPLTLVTGLVGYGLVGALAARFVRRLRAPGAGVGAALATGADPGAGPEEAAVSAAGSRGPTALRLAELRPPGVAEIGEVVFIGFVAAMIVYLAAYGGLAIFSATADGVGAQPNPYAVFATCLVGAAYYPEIWAKVRGWITGEKPA